MKERHLNNRPIARNWLIVLTAILLVITIGITVNGRAHVTAVENILGNIVRPVQAILTNISNGIAESTYPIRNVFNLARENEALKQELLEMQRRLIEQTLYREEYEDLKKLRKALNYAYRNNLNNYLTADVISRDAGNWYGMFVVNVGSDDGVTENAMVFNGSGLIGQVFELGNNWAKVLTITDVRGAVSFRIVDDVRNFDGVVSGRSTAEMVGYLFDPDGEVKIGDQLITSGLGVYPKGIIIGKVTGVKTNKETLLKHITVAPSVDFKQIDRVFIIPEINVIKE
ncbi:MAG: rod shape-determining protein MreC [Clostridiales bacterium]|nr:MAG: rod shape-determining protein MreC [Clostridiales bacterium]